MEKYYKIANFICALILLAVAALWFIAQAKNFLDASDGIVFFGAGLFIIWNCIKLVKITKRELKQ